MSDSTLILSPVWLFVLLFGAFVFFVIGMFGPYISAEDEEKAKKVKRVLGVPSIGEKVEIAIKCRIRLDMVAVCLVPVWIAILDVLFVSESFDSAVVAIGGGVVGAILVLISMAVADVLIFAVTQAIIAWGANIVELELANYYTRAYNATIVYVEEEAELV